VVLLNRAPTLHRLGIQAFEVKLIEGSAIQIHPLVCAAFNADFDGDQMAVHVPLSKQAQAEARSRMLSTANLLDPSDGLPVIAPTLEIVMGCYYMTVEREGRKGEGKLFSSGAEVELAYQMGIVDLHARVKVLDPKGTLGAFENGSNGAANPRIIESTVGRILFNREIPSEIPFRDEPMNRKALARLIGELYQVLGPQKTAEVADRIKDLGFKFATISGMTIGLQDVAVPETKATILEEADSSVAEVERQYRRGLITNRERHDQVVKIWQETREILQNAVEEALDEDNSLYIMSFSGAKGNMNQISQMAGMRGLMLDPNGNIMDFPIRSNFREGLDVFEYFISTHGARKGLADTALRTADSGYLTRRLVDVAQDVIVTDMDCGTESGMRIIPADYDSEETFNSAIVGRMAAAPVVTPDGEVLCDRNEEINEAIAAEILATGIESVLVRTAMNCERSYGICAMCYGRNLASGKLVELGEAVGIIAAQSIGEPGTQLTMRTFHTGGVSHADDITTGLPRIQELFEAREPKGKAILTEIEGTVEIVTEDDVRTIIVTNEDIVTHELEIPTSYKILVKDGDTVKRGTELATSESGEPPILSPMDGDLFLDGQLAKLVSDNTERKEYVVPHTAHVRVADGDHIQPGQQLTDGPRDPQEVLSSLGRDEVQRMLVEEVLNVYRSQGVDTNDKHIEVIVRQMLRKVSIDDPGDTDLLPGELVDRFQFNEINDEMIAQGGEPATAQEVILGITKASLETDSFLSAASFQETTRVLTQSAIEGKIDRLRGLKENVIIGKLIPAGSGFNAGGDDSGVVSEETEAVAEVEPKSIEEVEDLVSAAAAGAEESEVDELAGVDASNTED